MSTLKEVRVGYLPISLQLDVVYANKLLEIQWKMKCSNSVVALICLWEPESVIFFQKVYERKFPLLDKAFELLGLQNYRFLTLSFFFFFFFKWLNKFLLEICRLIFFTWLHYFNSCDFLVDVYSTNKRYFPTGARRIIVLWQILVSEKRTKQISQESVSHSLLPSFSVRMFVIFFFFFSWAKVIF